MKPSKALSRRRKAKECTPIKVTYRKSTSDCSWVLSETTHDYYQLSETESVLVSKPKMRGIK